MSQPSGREKSWASRMSGSVFGPRAATNAHVVVGSSTKSATLAGRIGDGFFGVTLSNQHLDAFQGAGGTVKSRLAQIHVCWAHSVDQARDTADRWRPNGALKGTALTELAHPKDFAQVLSRPAPTTSSKPSPSDPTRTATSTSSPPSPKPVQPVPPHQIGPDQEGALRSTRPK